MPNSLRMWVNRFPKEDENIRVTSMVDRMGHLNEGVCMNGIWGSEDIANNWMLLDLKNLRREVEAKGGRWDVDGYCKGYIDNPKLKLPLAYVDKRGNIFFNEAAKRFERPEEIKQRLMELWSLEGEPIVVLLTRSLRELAEVAPDTLITSIEGEGAKESLK